LWGLSLAVFKSQNRSAIGRLHRAEKNIQTYFSQAENPGFFAQSDVVRKLQFPGEKQDCDGAFFAKGKNAIGLNNPDLNHN